jgi:hypothetical protein
VLAKQFLDIGGGLLRLMMEVQQFVLEPLQTLEYVDQQIDLL